MDRKFGYLLAALSCCGMAGCSTTGATTTMQFPARWPEGMSLPVMRAAPAPGRGSGIAIAVAPWTWPGASEAGGQPTTTQAFTQLTQAALRAQGFDVVDEPSAVYRLGCSVRDLTSATRAGFPGEQHYLARVTCQLVRVSDQQLLWQRELEERVDETVYVNTYTRLPARAEQAFVRECVPAVMERLTEGLLTFFRDELPWRAERAAGHTVTPGEPAPLPAATDAAQAGAAPASYSK